MPNIETAIKFMEDIAADDSHGYSQDKRGGNPDFDCSSLVGTALNKAGFNVNALSTTRTLYDQLIKCGFKEIGINEARKRGDIFVTPGKHVVMCKDSNFIVHASINEKGTTTGGQSGDQTGKEICSRAFYYPSYGWKYHLRYTPPVQTSTNLTLGIDLSVYNVVTDYSKIKNAGYTFAFIKAIDKNGDPDKLFKEHYLGCSKAGIKIAGLYNYSYCTTVDKARLDAEKMIRVVGEIDVPIFLDVEDKCMQGLGETLIYIINTYKNVIEASGRAFGIYSGDSFISSYIKPFWSKLDTKNLIIWNSRYGKNTGELDLAYKPVNSYCDYWQYSSKAVVPGVNGYVDVNVVMKDEWKSLPPASVSDNEIPILVLGKTTSNLNVRKETNTSASIIRVANKGAFLQLVAEIGDWYKIGSGGYVHKDYIEFVHGKVIANKLFVRSEPDSSNDKNKIDVLSKDTNVIICSATSEWYHVLLSDGRTGWVSGKYIQLV